jgi:hypothetical protein
MQLLIHQAIIRTQGSRCFFHRTLVPILPFFSHITPVGVIDTHIAAGTVIVAGIIIIHLLPAGITIADLVPMALLLRHRHLHLLSVRGD